MTLFEGLHLSPWYLNTRRLNVYGGNRIPAVAQSSLARNSAERADGMYRAIHIAENILKSATIKSIVAAYDQLKAEEFSDCYIWDILNFSGVGKALSQGRTGNVTMPARFEGKIQIGDRIVKAYGQLSNDHLYSSSSTVLMKGRKRALLFGSMKRDEVGDVEVHPIIIGDMKFELAGMFTQSWANALRLYPQQIDAFAGIINVDKVTAKDAKNVLKLSEEDVKTAISEIVGEPFVPKDWGGERSDLYTSRLTVDGEPISTAFIFKGPSVPGPLHPANMGKRGDQLVRAFDEPAELIVIQHCAKIETTVVRLAEALAANPSKPRRYCILDGGDTYRVLKAHGKFENIFSN